MTLEDFLERSQYVVPPNTPDTSLWEVIKTFNENIESVKNFFSYVFHPQKLAILLWNFTVEYSFWICLFICLFSMLLYIVGYKKGAKWCKLSAFSYLTVQIFNSLI